MPIKIIHIATLLIEKQSEWIENPNLRTKKTIGRTYRLLGKLLEKHPEARKKLRFLTDPVIKKADQAGIKMLRI